MTRVDARGAPVSVGERELRILSGRLAAERAVVAAYLFGSQARGAPGPLSDIDLAVWAHPELDRRERWSLHEGLTGKAADALGTDAVQVVILNDAPPLLAHRVLREGRRLADADPTLRVRLETSAIVRYLDTLALREEIGRGLARRLAEGAYGRPRGD